MAQHDFNISNQGFPAFRADLNNALSATVTLSAGATEPSTTFAYQLWYDETADVLKIRNDDNDAWITLFTFDQTANTVTVSGEELVDDTTPQLGGDLDLNSSDITGTGNVNITGTVTADGLTVDTNTLYVDSANNRVGIGTTSPGAKLSVTGLQMNDAANGVELEGTWPWLKFKDTETNQDSWVQYVDSSNYIIKQIPYADRNAAPSTVGTERMRVDSNGSFLHGTTTSAGILGTTTNNGFSVSGSLNGQVNMAVDSNICISMNRNGTDGTLIAFRAQATPEGSISVSGSTVSYNGGHLARWSRLSDNSKDTSIVKGTVMTNLDEMVEWSHETTYWTEEDELPEGVSVGDVKTAAYVEDNEQLNKMAVSSVEGDANVAGVFVNWDDDDDWNDMNIAMTGDMVIRIAQGTTVARGDLLMSAGDGTAKPQDDDIVRSKTIAKVTSTHVSHTYDDGSYLVPCVLMAC